MANGSNTKAVDRLAGLAYLAVILTSGAGYLATTRLLASNPGAPLGYAAYAGELGASAWLLIMASPPSRAETP